MPDLLGNQMYGKAKDALNTGKINVEEDDLRAILVYRTIYTPAFGVDEFLSSVPDSARGPVTDTLTGVSSTLGAVTSDQLVWEDVSVGDDYHAVILLVWNDDPALCRLHTYYDTAAVLPVTPTGGDITFTPDPGPDKLYHL